MKQLLKLAPELIFLFLAGCMGIAAYCFIASLSISIILLTVGAIFLLAWVVAFAIRISVMLQDIRQMQLRDSELMDALREQLRLR